MVDKTKWTLKRASYELFYIFVPAVKTGNQRV